LLWLMKTSKGTCSCGCGYLFDRSDLGHDAYNAQLGRFGQIQSGILK